PESTIVSTMIPNKYEPMTAASWRLGCLPRHRMSSYWLLCYVLNGFAKYVVRHASFRIAMRDSQMLLLVVVMITIIANRKRAGKTSPYFRIIVLALRLDLTPAAACAISLRSHSRLPISPVLRPATASLPRTATDHRQLCGAS